MSCRRGRRLRKSCFLERVDFGEKSASRGAFRERPFSVTSHGCDEFGYLAVGLSDGMAEDVDCEWSRRPDDAVFTSTRCASRLQILNVSPNE